MSENLSTLRMQGWIAPKMFVDDQGDRIRIQDDDMEKKKQPPIFG